MEKLDTGCILLKQKEYKDLLEKEKKIKIEIKYSHYQEVGSFNVSGDFQLGNDLFNQLKNISTMFTKKLKSKADAIYENGKKDGNVIGREYAVKAFSKLPWYKRLFFDEDDFNKIKYGFDDQKRP